MTLRSESEPRRVPAPYLERIDQVREHISPDDPGLREWYDTYARGHRERLAHDLRMVDGLASDGARILEYGAIPLLMTAALELTGYEVSAVDLAPERFGSSIADLGLDVRKVDVEHEMLPFPDDTFVVVLMNELFEHLRIDPIFTLREAQRVLAPGGTLLLSTPNLRSLRGVRNLLLYNQAYASSAGVYQQYEKLERLGHMGHVREYTTREVVEFLERIGFVAERLVFRGGHGRGVVGLLERVFPSWRPMFTAVVRVPGDQA